MYDENINAKPNPFCKLSEIENLGADHETPSAYHDHVDYDAHHIFFNVRGRQYHLYTFEPGTDLLWRLKNAIANAYRFARSTPDNGPELAAGHIRMVTVDGKETPEHYHYSRIFHQIAAQIVHVPNHRDRINALRELEELAQKFFPAKTLFFQSSALIQYFMDALQFLADLHTVPTQVRVDRLSQIELITWILKIVSQILDGATVVHGSPALLTYNKATRFRTLIRSIFQVEWYILSQPARSRFFMSYIPEADHENYLRFLQEIESTSASLLCQLYALGILTWRQRKQEIPRELFLSIIRDEVKSFVTDGFHTIVYMLVRMAEAMPTIKPIHSVYCHSLLDHLWFVNYSMLNIPGAAEFVKKEFISEFTVIVTEKRMIDFLKNGVKGESQIVVDDILTQLRSIQDILKKTKLDKQAMKDLPILFR
jgi:hypothetical protein